MSERLNRMMRLFREQEDELNGRVRQAEEGFRKGTATIHVSDASGAPVPGVRLTVRQKSHEFQHGANLFMLGQLDEERNARYEDAFRRAFNTATLPFYWNGIEPEEGKTRYAADSPNLYRRPAPDLCLEYCEANGITPKLHCLNYDNWTPPWAPYDAKTIRALVEKRMREIASRYADRIPGIEVTNEYMLFSPGRQIDRPERHNTDQYFTEDIIEWSFERARHYFPDNELIINEAAVWGEHFKYNRSGYYMQIERALRKGVSIDTVGIQNHIMVTPDTEARQVDTMCNPEYIWRVLDQYADFGLPIQITEISVSAGTDDSEGEELQAQLLYNLCRTWFAHPAVKGAIYWNLPDGCAYVQKGMRNENIYHAGLLRSDMSEKPAYKALVNLFQKEWHTEAETGAGDDGTARFRGFYGDYDVTLTLPDGRRAQKTLSLKKDGLNRFRFTL